MRLASIAKSVIGLLRSYFGISRNGTNLQLNPTGGQVLTPAGTSAAPAVAVGGSAATTGLYQHDANTLGLAGSGAGILVAAATSPKVLALANSYALGFSTSNGASCDILLQRQAANTLGLKNGTNAQALRVYNTDDGAGNTEWLDVGWGTLAANTLTIRPQQTGTGATRAIQILGSGTAALGLQLGAGSTVYLGMDGASRSNLGYWNISGADAAVYPKTDNTYDLGDATHRPRSLYFGTSIISPAGATNATTGFVYISAAAGTPTGVPSQAAAGIAPLYYDTTAHKLWVYDQPAGAWKGVAVV